MNPRNVFNISWWTEHILLLLKWQQEMLLLDELVSCTTHVCHNPANADHQLKLLCLIMTNNWLIDWLLLFCVLDERNSCNCDEKDLKASNEPHNELVNLTILLLLFRVWNAGWRIACFCFGSRNNLTSGQNCCKMHQNNAFFQVF